MKAKLVVAFAVGVIIAVLVMGIVHELNVGKVRQSFMQWSGTSWAYTQISETVKRWLRQLPA